MDNERLLDITFEFQSALISRATGEVEPVGFDYNISRKILLSEISNKNIVPEYLNRCHTIGHFWSFIQAKFPTYKERRTYIWDTFSELITFLETNNSASQIIVDGFEKNFSASEASHSFILEQNKKCKDKLANNDFDGAITNARSMVEAVFEEVLRESGIPNVRDDGDLLKLYKQVKDALNLNPGQVDLSQTLQQTLSGLNSIVVGLSGISNKMGDRHKRKYKPEKHHADLVVNTAFALCEFIVSSLEYQKAKKI